jgi:copper(I)-binding protein
MVVAVMVVTASHASAQGKTPETSNAWVAEPAAGATATAAYAVIDNPTMYDIYVVKVETDVAGSVEMGDGSKTVKSITVPSFGSTELTPSGTRIQLKDLKKPLKAGDVVVLTLTTDQGVTMRVEATVKKP